MVKDSLAQGLLVTILFYILMIFLKLAGICSLPDFVFTKNGVILFYIFISIGVILFMRI